MNNEQQVVIYRLAHENNLTLDNFLDRLEEIFHVDTSNYPKDETGAVIYPDGLVGIELEMPLAEEMLIHKAAEKMGLTTNEFMLKAVNEQIEELKKTNPDAFKDLNDKN